MWIVFIVPWIPTIRPIFVKAINKITSSKNRIFPSGRGYTAQENSATNGSHVRAYSSTKKTTGSSRITSIIKKNDSEGNILPSQGGMRMTTEIQINYQEDRSQSFSDKKGLD
jgi:hypothetical protein